MTVAGPTKIVRVIARLNVGGPARHVIYLTERMNRGRYRTILVKGSESEAEGTMEPLARERGVELVHVPGLGREIRLSDDWFAFWKLFRLLREERPDVLHTHTAKAGALGRVAGLLYRWTTPGGRALRVFHTFHGHVLEGYFGRWKSLLFRWTEKLLARTCSGIITLSEGLREELAGFGVTPRGRISVVPLGLELEDLLALGGPQAARRDSPLRASLGIACEAFVVGVVGRLVPVKDHETMFQAVRLLREGGLDVHLAVVGDGELRADLERRASGLGLGERVHFLGWRMDLAAIYQGVDAVSLCSLNEGTPVSLIEALAAARPVAATAVGGVPDLLGCRGGLAEGLAPGEVVPAERGLVVRPRDPGALASALRMIREDAVAAESRARRGREYVRERHGVERLVESLSNLYERHLT